MRSYLSLLFIFSLLSIPAFAEQAELFVFVGEQLELEYIEDEESWDEKYEAKYRILKSIYGDYTESSIEFTVYDHMGYPDFADYRYVMLILVKEGGHWFHEKYQFFDLYKTSNQDWAFCGIPEDYTDELVEPRPLKAIDFRPELSYSTVIYSEKANEEKYPKDIFKYANNRAICKKGVVLDELWRIKREGILKNRGYTFK